MKLNKLNKKRIYALACSFGPDSMSLFDLLIKNNYKFFVCHCNYHLREESDLEERELRKYCEKNNIPFFVNELYYKKEYGNLEEWCRKTRYEFFLETAIKNFSCDILIAHNEDDLIETYLLQLKRNSVVSYYGLNKKYNINGIDYIRPLLNISKKDLQEYCDENNVPYSIDKTNLLDCCERNRIRHEIVSKMNRYERDKIILEINKKNRDLQKRIYEIAEYFSKSVLTKDEILNFSIDDFQLIVISKLKLLQIYKPISKKFILDIYEKVKINKTINYCNENYRIFYSYEEFFIGRPVTEKYRFNLKERNTELMFKNNTKSPLFSYIQSNGAYIKTVGLDDYFEINGMKKRVNRLFIDQKMPYQIREIWPGIYDKENKLIYTPHYHKDNNDNNSPIIFDIDILINCFLLYKIK